MVVFQKIVVVKKGAGYKPADKSARPERGGQRRERENLGSDDGMSYNPFAALLKNRK